MAPDALIVEDAEAIRIARELSQQTGRMESQVIADALRHEAQSLALAAGEPPSATVRRAEVRATLEQLWTLEPRADRLPDDFLWNEDGLPP